MRFMECQGLIWTINEKATDQLSRRWADFEALGFLPGFLNAADPRPAQEQLEANYTMGGGWHTGPTDIDEDGTMLYPGDDPLPWVIGTHLRDERILFYPFALVAIVQPDGSFVTQRMD